MAISTSVQRMVENRGIRVREEYTCDANGNLRVKFSTTPSGRAREYAIGQLAGEEAMLVKITQERATRKSTTPERC
jgi:hypothetical protein